MHSTLCKIFSRRLTEFFFFFFSYFSQKTGFNISCKMSPLETICMKCNILFPGKIKKNIGNVSSAELNWRVVKVNSLVMVFCYLFWDATANRVCQ